MNKKRKTTSEITEKLHNFYKRWNISFNEAEKWAEFKNRFMNSYIDAIGNKIHLDNKRIREFHEIVGLHFLVKQTFLPDFGNETSVGVCPVYLALHKTTDNKKFLLNIQALFWMNSLDKKDKDSLRKKIITDIRISQVPIEFKITKSDILLYPSGAKLLDEKLVDENLDWLENYPDAYKKFSNAVKLLEDQSKKSDVANNLRLALELFLRQRLNNTKSLENQKEELGKFLETNKANKEIRNLFWQLLDYYSKYQNNNVKHGDAVKDNEVEFLLYLTGAFIRFLIKQ